MRFALLLVILPAFLAAEPFPDRPGKKTIDKLCGGCHGLQYFAAMRKNRAAWTISVNDMASRGMNAEDAEIETAIDYLARYLTRLNVNQAPAAQLADILSLAPAEADAIVAYRTKNGEFPNFDALVKVPGVDPKKLAAQRDRIGFSGQ